MEINFLFLLGPSGHVTHYFSYFILNEIREKRLTFP
jgi:hypothetical protein